jgi:hypothetical protein
MWLRKFDSSSNFRTGNKLVRDASGGPSLATANSYTTPALTTTTSYYVDATMEIAQMPLERVIATIAISYNYSHN